MGTHAAPPGSQGTLADRVYVCVWGAGGYVWEVKSTVIASGYIIGGEGWSKRDRKASFNVTL